MEIAIISEGAYPYIAGGVSSWAQQLIMSMSENKFKIISIMPSKKMNLEYKYDLPPNVIQIKTLYLDGFMQIPALKRKKEPKLNKKESLEVEKFLNFNRETDWNIIAGSLADKNKLGDCMQFLKSEFFWEILLRKYYDLSPNEEFNRFFWTLQSMYMPLLNLLQTEGVKADLYHSVSTGYAGLIGLIYKSKYNKPLILTEHGIYAREREEELIKARWVEGVYKKMWIDFFYFIAQGVYKEADAVVSLFNRNREIQIAAGTERKKAVVIPNGIDLDEISFEIKAEPGKNIGAILRVVPIKDIKTLLRAFKIVQEKLRETKLFLIGGYDDDPAYYLECKNMVAILDMEDSVVFTGQVSIAPYLKKLDVLVLTSISEGQPLVMLEGMAASIPFVATDVGSCRELIEGTSEDSFGPAGIVTKPVSPPETAAAILKILTNNDLSREMGRNARKRVEKYYRKEKFISGYKELYKDVFSAHITHYKQPQAIRSSAFRVTKQFRG